MSKELTPVQKLAQVEALLEEAISERDALRTEKAEISASLNTANDSLTKANGDLASERAAHSQTKADLEKVKADLVSANAAKDALQKDFDAKVSTEAAKIVAAQGAKPVAAAVNNEPAKTEGAEKPKTYLDKFAAGAAHLFHKS